MTSSMPSGDGTVTSGPAETELDTEAAPDTGLEPDTAPDAAGEADTSAGSDAPAAPTHDDDADRTGELTEIDGPALENDEMRRGTDELRSSEGKAAEAREIAGELRTRTLPGGGE